MKERTLLVGGLSRVHDALLAAALRGVGVDTVALTPRTNRGLALARAVGNHGQCNPAHYAVGAVLEHARASGLAPAEFASTHAWLTVGSCGPCRLAAFGFEYSRVLAASRLGDLAIHLVDSLSFLPARGQSPLFQIEPSRARALLSAVVAGDVLSRSGLELRPYAVDPADVDAVVDAGICDLVFALERGASPLAAIEAHGERARAVPRDRTRVLPRVVVTGEPWTTLADGDPSYDLLRRLANHGAEVLAPTASDWLRYQIWTAKEDARRSARDVVPTREVDALDRADHEVVRLWTSLASAAGIDGASLADPDELAELARPYYPPEVRGGSAHLEVGRILMAQRDHLAHLALSLKPFGCLPSSALSDGIVSVLLCDDPRMRFLAIETTGDADATTESRVEMALSAATAVAERELAVACESRGLTSSGARLALESRAEQAPPPPGRRRFACTAAETLWRE